MLQVIRHPLASLERRFPLFYEDLLAVAVCAAVVALVVSAIWGAVLLYGSAERTTCFSKTDELGVSDADWGYWSGCRVEVDGNLVPIDNYRVTR